MGGESWTNSQPNFLPRSPASKVIIWGAASGSALLLKVIPGDIGTTHDGLFCREELRGEKSTIGRHWDDGFIS